MDPLCGRWNRHHITSMAYMFQQTLTTAQDSCSRHQGSPCSCSADWPRATFWKQHTMQANGKTGECPTTRPSRHSIAQNTLLCSDTLVGGPQACLVKDEMGRDGTMEQATHPHDNALPARYTIHMILTPDMPPQPPPYDVDRWAWPWSHPRWTHGNPPRNTGTRPWSALTMYTGQAAYCRLPRFGSCQPAPAHGRSGESKR